MASAPQRGISGKNSGFVTTKGTRFSLNDKPFYCAGTNAYYAALQSFMSDNEVHVMMKVHADKGAMVMRAFANSNFNFTADPMMPAFDVYNEEAIRRLDLLLAAAADNGIRLILTLANFWQHHGGAQDWVDIGIGKGHSLTLFYTDPTLRQHYKDWVKHIVMRTNTVTGQKYVDDPTILAWELINEPRVLIQTFPTGGGSSNGDIGNIERNQGLEPGRIICDWIADMGAYVKSLDSTHLLTSGDEGWRSDGHASEPYAWIDNGYEGVNFTCDVGNKYIDFATVHVYPDLVGMPPPDGYTWMDKNFIQDRAKLVHSMGKPIIMEEYGQMRNTYGPRENLLTWLQDRANENDYACTLVWAVSHASTDTATKGQLFGADDGQGYVFGYDGDGAQAVLRQYAYMKAKADGFVTPTHDVSARPPPS